MHNLKQLCLACLLVALIVAPLGCKKKVGWGGHDEEEVQKNPLKPVAGDNMAQSDVLRGTQKRLVEGMMRQIGIFFNIYVSDMGRPPATVEEFKEYIKRDGRNEYTAIDKGQIIFVPNVRPGSRTVLAYEKDKYEKWNNRVVLFVNGDVQTLEEAEFQEALKVKGQ
jgi:hypothetical protein